MHLFLLSLLLSPLSLSFRSLLSQSPRVIDHSSAFPLRLGFENERSCQQSKTIVFHLLLSLSVLASVVLCKPSALYNSAFRAG